MFVGGAVGTSLNAKIIGSFGISYIYLLAAVLILAVGFSTYIFMRGE
jgi:hypothetical protein